MFHFMIDVMQGLYYSRMHYRWWSLTEYYLAISKDRQTEKASLISAQKDSLEERNKEQGNVGGLP
jgi:hypothetical protein